MLCSTVVGQCCDVLQVCACERVLCCALLLLVSVFLNIIYI